LLKLPQQDISISANFFELGGHSLLLLKLIIEIRQAFAIEISLKLMFESKDLRDLAGLIDTLKKQAAIKSQLSGTAADEIEEVEF
jgi:acyl carrier protein